MDKKTAFIILAVVIAGLIIWNVAKNKAQEKAEWQEELKELQREQKVIDCQNAGYEDYLVNWDSACDANGFVSSCSLPMNIAKTINETYQDALDRCIVMYK